MIAEFAVAGSGNLGPITSVTGDANVWFGDGANVDSITPGAQITKYSVCQSGCTVTAITGVPAAGGKGPLLWFTTGIGVGSLDIGAKPPTATFHTVDASNSSGANGLSTGIAVDAAGHPWFGNVGKNSIECYCQRGSAAAKFETYPISSSANSLPSGFTLGSDGNIWFTETAGNKLGRIDPRVDPSTGGTPAISEVALPLDAQSNRPLYPGALIMGPDKALWFTEGNGPGIGRATPDGSTVSQYSTPTQYASPGGIANGPDGNLWFTEASVAKVGRITAVDDSIREFSIGDANARPIGIATGPDGAVWFSDPSTYKIGRVDLAAINGPPAVSSLNPNQTQASTETDVQINGSGFFDGDTGKDRVSGVSFGDQPAASYTVLNDSTIRAKAPPLPSGQVHVLVTAAGNKVSPESAANLFTIVALPPPPPKDYVAGTWAPEHDLTTKRQFHTATLLDGPRCRADAPPAYCGMTLVAGGIDGGGLTNGHPNHPYSLKSAELYDPSRDIWQPVASMNQPRSHHTATLLDGPECHGRPSTSPGVASLPGSLDHCGKVLVVGGRDSDSVGISQAGLATAELYDPAVGKWVLLKQQQHGGRFDHTATLLTGPGCDRSCGMVLVAGGALTEQHQQPVGSTETSASSELYDPANGAEGSWSDCSSATVIAAARQIVPAPPPRSGCPGPLNVVRSVHAATLLENGSVLVSGGLGTDGGQASPGNPVLASAEIFTPADGTWRKTADLPVPVFDQTSTLLSGPACVSSARPSFCGRVLVAGGLIGTSGFTNSSELYDPGRRSWTATGSMLEPRGGHTATVLFDGKVLVAGSGTRMDNFFSSPNLYGHKSVEVYDPPRGIWVRTVPLAVGRGNHSATMQWGRGCEGAAPPGWCGSVLVAGGADQGCSDNCANFDPFASTERFSAAPGVDLLSPAGGPTTGGTRVVITGNAFTGMSTVTFGVLPATAVSVDSFTQITATSPAYPAAGTVEVAVTTPAGQSSASVPARDAEAAFTYSACNVSPRAGEVAYPAGYSLIGAPGGLHLPSLFYMYGWFDQGGGQSYTASKPADTPTEPGHGYWGYLSCAQPVSMSGPGITPAAAANFSLRGYHASMVGNPSATSPAGVVGHDFAATWHPEMNGGAGGYAVSGYQEPQSIAVGHGVWVFAYRDTNIRIQAAGP